MQPYGENVWRREGRPGRGWAWRTNPRFIGFSDQLSSRLGMDQALKTRQKVVRHVNDKDQLSANRFFFSSVSHCSQILDSSRQKRLEANKAIEILVSILYCRGTMRWVLVCSNCIIWLWVSWGKASEGCSEELFPRSRLYEVFSSWRRTPLAPRELLNEDMKPSRRQSSRGLREEQS